MSIDTTWSAPLWAADVLSEPLKSIAASLQELTDHRTGRRYRHWLRLRERALEVLDDIFDYEHPAEDLRWLHIIVNRVADGIGNVDRNRADDPTGDWRRYDAEESLLDLEREGLDWDVSNTQHVGPILKEIWVRSVKRVREQQAELKRERMASQ